MSKTHLRTFLANMSRDSVECVQRYARYNDGTKKGYNYFWSSEKAIRELAIEGAPFDAAVGVCGQIKKADERVANQTAVRAFHAWFLKNKRAGFPPPRATLFGPQGQLEVLVAPDIALMRGKSQEIVLTWAYRNVPLTRRIAGIGVFILRRELSTLCPTGTKFFVHDLVAQVRHSEAAIPLNAEKIVEIELAKQEAALLATAAA